MKTFLNNNFDPHIFDQYTKAIIVGKGPTFKAITKPDENTLLMGVNHAVDFLINPDIVLCQDVEFFSDFKQNGRYINVEITEKQDRSRQRRKGKKRNDGQKARGHFSRRRNRRSSDFKQGVGQSRPRRNRRK